MVTHTLYRLGFYLTGQAAFKSVRVLNDLIRNGQTDGWMVPNALSLIITLLLPIKLVKSDKCSSYP